MTSKITETLGRGNTVDLAVATYTVLTGALIAARHPHIADAPSLFGLHALLLVLLAALPPRGADWEKPRPHETGWKKTSRDSARFLRYTYPLALVIFFFEEVEHTVNALAPAHPYWFEPYLYAADRWLFGELPAVILSRWTGPLQDEVMHGFYFSYYFIVVGGAVVAYRGSRGEGPPGRGFDTVMASTVIGYLLSFVWYPLLPARGPWENPRLAGLTPFQGMVFTPLVEWIIRQGAVSGGCFPSSHVSGACGLVLGLAGFRPRAAFVLGVLATGMSLACVYTRYHHAVDVLTGLAAAILGALLARRLAPDRGR